MLRRLGIVFVALALTLLVASPALAQSSLGDSIENFTNDLIDRTFSDVFGSPSQSQYDQPGAGGGGGGTGGGAAVSPEVGQNLCSSIVQNEAIPSSIQSQIAEQFDLDCEPSGSFFDSFFGGFFNSFFGGFFGFFDNLFGF